MHPALAAIEAHLSIMQCRAVIQSIVYLFARPILLMLVTVMAMCLEVSHSVTPRNALYVVLYCVY